MTCNFMVCPEPKEMCILGRSEHAQVRESGSGSAAAATAWGRLLLRGESQAQVARRVGVTRSTVSDWNESLAQGGLEALKRRPRGRPAGLDVAQRRELMQTLTRGALAEGFATDLWTLPRVG